MVKSPSWVGAWIPVAGYCLLIVVGSSIPASSVPDTGWVHLDKLVHGGEYALLGALLTRAWLLGPPRLGFLGALFWAVLAAGLFGVSDELHQYLTPGRDPSLGDLCADLAGAVVGALAAGLFYRLRRRRLAE